MSTYAELIQDIFDEIDEDEKTANIAPESMRGYILQACQQIAQRLPVRDETTLRLIYGQDRYEFTDTTIPIVGTGTINAVDNTVTGVTATGTGTISTVGRTVTGSGTAFLTELAVGKMIIVGTEKKTVQTITSNDDCTIDGNFDTDLVASAFTYSTTKFTKEIAVGSVIVSNSISKTVETITDAYNLTVTAAYVVPQTGQAFTVDTDVTEIPTRFSCITGCDRLEGTTPRIVEVVSHEVLTRQKELDGGVGYYSNLDQPYIIAEWQEGSTRYLEVYPSVETDKEITLYGFVKVNPRFYATDETTDTIPLSQDYDPAIKEYVKHRVYRRIKDEKLADASWMMFENYIRQTLINFPVTRRVTVV